MSRLTIRNLFFFICVAFLAYLPLTSFLFALKNDSFTGYFPVKFFMSESLHAGYFPAWNPYLNYGLPMHGDLSSGFWNPITWLIAGTWGYNVYSFTFEEIFYLVAGAAGMYQLTGYWKLQRFPRLIASIAYLCCGYNVGHLQHFNWISGAAFLPWCIDGYLRALREFSVKNLLAATFSFYFLFATAHPGIIIGAMYFLFPLAIFHLIQATQSQSKSAKIKELASRHLFLLLPVLLLSAGIIYSVWEIIPQITRGQKISLGDSIREPSSVQSWISLFLPFCTTKNDSFFNNDISMRNSYFSVALLVFLIYGLVSNKNSWQKLLLCLAGFFFLLSSTVFFKELAYKFLPFTGYVRLSGEFRIFTILSLILFSAISFDKYLDTETTVPRRLVNIIYSLGILSALVFVFSLFKLISTKESIFFRFKSIDTFSTTGHFLKQVIDKISFYDALLVQATIQFFILYAILQVLKAGNKRLVLALVIIDLVLATLFNMPFTGVGQMTNPEVQAIIDRSKPGIPPPELIATTILPSGDSDLNKIVGNWSMYSKQIGTLEKVPYPINLSTTENYFSSTKKTEIDQQPYLFFADNGHSSISLLEFSPSAIVVELQSEANNQLIYKQNFYPRWKYSIDGKPGTPQAFSGTFLQVPVTAGQHKVVLFYRSTDIKILVTVTGILFTLVFSYLIYLGKKKKPSV